MTGLAAGVMAGGGGGHGGGHAVREHRFVSPLQVDATSS